jgi:tRNA(Ile)-lysidine synthetase-like protein
MRDQWPNTFHFSPCPSLGDPDGVEILGDGRFALFNPDDRALKLRVGSYLPRQPRRAPATASVTATGPKGRALFHEDVPIEHIHGDHAHPDINLRTGRGVSFLDVEGVERWLAFTYPATPLVLVGDQTEGDWRRFRFTVGTARNWYFHVPPGTKQFSVRASVEHDALLLRGAEEEPAPLAPALLEVPGSVSVADGIVRADPAEVPTEGIAPDADDADVEYVDADRLEGPLTVGSAREGERMRPLGMSGTKKLSDVMMDAKVPMRRRARVPIVREGDHVVWVAGIRLSEAHRITRDTRRVVRLAYTRER